MIEAKEPGCSFRWNGDPVLTICHNRYAGDIGPGCRRQTAGCFLEIEARSGLRPNQRQVLACTENAQCWNWIYDHRSICVSRLEDLGSRIRNFALDRLIQK